MVVPFFVLGFGCAKSPAQQRVAIEKIQTLGGIVDVYGREDIAKRGVPAELKGAVKGISFDTSDKFDDDVARVIPWPTLEICYLSRMKVTDQQVAGLSAAKRLLELDLSGTLVTDRTLEKLQSNNPLRELFLDRCEISDEGLRALESITTLKALSVRDTHVTQEGVDRLKAKLGKKLDVTWSTASPKVRKALLELEQAGADIGGLIGEAAKKHSLRYSVKFAKRWRETNSADLLAESLNTIANDDDTMVYIDSPDPRLSGIVKHAVRLNQLNIRSNAKWNLVAIESLADGIEIKSFDWQTPELTSAQVLALSKIRGLESLRVQRARIQNDALAASARWKSLKLLDLFDVDLQGVSLKVLSNAPALKQLRLSRCKNITAEELQMLREKGMEVLTE